MLNLCCVFLFCCVFPAFAADHLAQPVLILNAANQSELPRNFRSCAAAKDSEVGLNALRLSGSGQFSEEGLKAALKQIGNAKVIVVDLRQECHGFINGTAVSWFGFRNWANVGKTNEQIGQEEAQRLADLLKAQEVAVQHVVEKTHEGGIEIATTETFSVQSALSEEQVTKNLNVGYFRLYVTDHRASTVAEVQRFQSFFNQQPADVWLHIHCAAGDGRTTTFMAMVDMMKNAKKVSFEDIIARQAALGGIDLLHKAHEGSWKRPLEIERADFLRKFYQYCKGNADNFQSTWK